MPDPDGSMLAWPQVPTLDCWLCLLLSMFHYTHSCASKSGMVHTHVGMPSQACVSISNQAQIKSNQVLHTIPKAHFTTRHPSNDNTSTPKMRTNRPHDVAHASEPVIPSRECVDAAYGCPCAAAPERATVRRAPPLHPPLGGRRREEPGRGGVGVSEGGPPMG